MASVDQVVRSELAKAMTDRDAYASAIARVRALHWSRDDGTCGARCYSSGMAPQRWPCATLRALDGEDGA